jgi:hypothetical protein
MCHTRAEQVCTPAMNLTAVLVWRRVATAAVHLSAARWLQLLRCDAPTCAVSSVSRVVYHWGRCISLSNSEGDGNSTTVASCALEQYEGET